MRLSIPLLAMCVIAGTPARAAPKMVTSFLVCGSARLTAVSHFDPKVPPDDNFVMLAQTVSLVASPSSKPMVIQVGPQPRSGEVGLPAAIASWACLTGTKGKTYVSFDVSCLREDSDGACHGEKEWFPLMSTDGTRPDAGYALQDPRYDALYRRLGISDDGVQMTGIW